MSIRGVLSGVLLLAVLENLVTSSSTNTLANAGNGVASLVRRAFSPAVPLIPDLRSTTLGASAAATPAVVEAPTTKATTPAAPTQIISV